MLCYTIAHINKPVVWIGLYFVGHYDATHRVTRHRDQGADQRCLLVFWQSAPVDHSVRKFSELIHECAVCCRSVCFICEQPEYD